MKFVARQPDDSVNLPQGSHLGWFVKLLAELLLVAVLLYLGLGVIAEQLAVRLPVATEQRWFGDLSLGEQVTEPPDEAALYLQDLVERLAADQPELGYRFRVRVHCSEIVNAVALPGGTIVLFEGLLSRLTSENQLSMVLAHEIGHFAHRDHMRSLGRALVPTLLAVALGVAGDGTLSRLLQSSTSLEQLRYSRAQERRADRTGLELLQHRYGHVAGATATFTHLADASSGNAWLPELLSTHPDEERRITLLERRIARQGWSLAAETPLPDSLRTQLCAGTQPPLQDAP